MRRRVVSVCAGIVCMSMILFAGVSKATTTSITISAAGDCTFSSDIKASRATNFYSQYKAKGPGFFMKKVKSVFKKDDLSIVNFEGTVSKRGERANKLWAFRGLPKYVDILKLGFIEAVGLANNHIRDYGEVSFQDTKKYLKKEGISYSSGTDVTVRTVKGIKVGMISISAVESAAVSVAILKGAIKKMKKLDHQLLIVNIHAGVEYAKTPNSIQRTLAHMAIDKGGADLVIGHHPHVIQPIERYKGVYIAYSLGNFSFGGNSNPRDKASLIFQQVFTLENGKLKKGAAAKIIPCLLSSVSYRNNYQPVICKGDNKKQILSRMRNYSKAFQVDINKYGRLS